MVFDATVELEKKIKVGRKVFLEAGTVLDF
jgi:hypothetical protein